MAARQHRAVRRGRQRLPGLPGREGDGRGSPGGSCSPVTPVEVNKESHFSLLMFEGILKMRKS